MTRSAVGCTQIQLPGAALEAGGGENSGGKTEGNAVGIVKTGGAPLDPGGNGLGNELGKTVGNGEVGGASGGAFEPLGFDDGVPLA